MKTKKYYVYKITNLVDKKIYIGKTTNIAKRWSAHKSTAKTQKVYKTKKSYLYNAINSYGVDNFIIQKLTEHLSEEEALATEINLIESFNSTNPEIGYNLTRGGEGVSGFKFSEESKKKISKSRKGKCAGIDHPFFQKEKTTSLRGENVSTAKLNEEQVINLLNDRKTGMTWKKLGEKYKISLQAAWYIGTGRNWKHVK